MWNSLSAPKVSLLFVISFLRVLYYIYLHIVLHFLVNDVFSVV